MRKPFQGIRNIIRFNYHLYLIVGAIIILLVLGIDMLPEALRIVLISGEILLTVAVVISLLVSFYIYDCSNFYELHWLDNLNGHNVLNITAGFDETSQIIKNKFPGSDVTSCDFFDPGKHTEISLKRARKAYPAVEGTILIETSRAPFEDNFFDYSIAVFSLHEIRNEKERIQFLKELGRITKSEGQILVTEHLRDLNNFLAYTIGFMHFYSRSSWEKAFRLSDLILKKQIKTTPFVTTFILEKRHGNTF